MKGHRTNAVFCLAVLLFALLQASFYLGLPFDWWMEDDPALFVAAAKVKNPLNFFFDRGLFSYGAGNALTPMNMLSYWIDTTLFPKNVLAAYLHQIMSFVVATGLLFCTAFLLFRNRFLAFFLTISWCCLPTTQAVVEFLSTRHYLEGFIWFVASILCLALLDKKSSERRNRTLLGFSFLFGMAAFLSKEIYVATLTPILVLVLFYERRFRWLLILFGLLLGYVSYRSWALGMSLNYTMPLLRGRDIFRFLARYPYFISGNHGGYLLGLAGLIGIGFGLARHNENRHRLFIILVPAFGFGFLATYPVWYALLNYWQPPGTWYRVPFLSNSLFLFALFLGFELIDNHKWKMVCLSITLAIICQGSWITRQTWDDLKRHNRAEGEFLLKGYQDRILFSTNPAFWFAGGIASMYGQPMTPFITSNDSGQLKKLLAAGPDQRSIWRYNGREVVHDRVLEDEIFQALGSKK